jgi:DNA-binding transcriptional ArsR family regulator
MAELPLDRTYKAPGELPPHFFSALASQMLDALSSSTSEPIRVIDEKLQAVIRSILAGASPDAVTAVQRGNGVTAVIDAYVLGQINFAESLAANAASSRMDEPALQMLREPRYAPYIDALQHGERTNTELAQGLRQTEETVSRNIGRLRREGITDFRKYGRSVYNFLTPVSRQILDAENAKKDEREIETGLEVREFLCSLVRNLPEHLQGQQTFAAASS